MRICWAHYMFMAVIIALALMTMLAGCGAKGDLFLPPDEKAAVQPAAPETAQPQPEAEPQ